MSSVFRLLTVATFLMWAAMSGVNAADAISMYDFDKQNTIVQFNYDVVLAGTMTGQFKDASAKILLDETDPTKSKAEVIIKTQGVEGQTWLSTSKIQGPDFLYIEKYPEIRFVSTKFAAKNDSEGTMTGNLTMRGVTKPVLFELDLKFANRQTNATVLKLFNNSSMPAIYGRAKIKMSSFGVPPSSLVADDIVIEFRALMKPLGEGQVSSEAPAQ